MQNHQTLINKNNNGVIVAIAVLMYGATATSFEIVKNLDDFTVKKYFTFEMPIGIKHALIEQIDVEPSKGSTTYTQDCIKGDDGVFLFTPSCIKIFSAMKLRDAYFDNEVAQSNFDGTFTVPDHLTRGFTTTLKLEDIEIS